jgi:predicted membrane channel-forming protein YqfA (hemolysin III family)
MRKMLEWVKNNPNRAMFLLPIVLVAVISISHVVSWYEMTNPITWAIYLSIAIEVGAITALVAATNKIKGGIWFMFGVVTFIQMVGNIFYSFKEIDADGELFNSWIELTGPIWELMGTDTTDITGMKRWLAFLEGGLLPIISLTSLHFFVKYEKSEEEVEEVSTDYNPMTEHPEDVYTPKGEETIDVVERPKKITPDEIKKKGQS